MGRTALKITLAVAMAAGLLLGVSGCGKSAEAEKQAPASKAGTEKVLRVGGEATYPPFLFKDEHGHYVGFEMDLIKAVAKEIGAEVAYTDMPFSQFMTAVENKKVDVVISAVKVRRNVLKNRRSAMCITRKACTVSLYEKMMIGSMRQMI